ncbi:MAG: urea carboxylase [Bryobacterales bacterium]|nr:urea carboxylase [Bryobacterales bacterium]
MFKKILIANRGAIACRIIRTLDRMGVGSVAVYSEADAHSLHVAQAGEAVCLGPAAAAQSYLNVERVLAAALQTGAEAIHPGYGFLSENASFAQRCVEEGIVFIGPTAQQMRDFGLKHTARAIAAENGLPMLPGTGLLADAAMAAAEAGRIGYPVMLKSTAGGGGIGMRLCRDESQLVDAFDAVQRLGQTNFRDGGIFLERYVEHARHIEVQIFGDGRGGVIELGERDCSVQRRNQKVIEETPAPNVPDGVRRQMLEMAVRLGRAVQYRSAGTVEYVYDAAREEFYFLEVNTRLQVEHGVTEETHGVDLVEWMVRSAAGEMPTLERPRAEGASIQVRVYAEDPGKDLQPSSGLLTHVHFPDSVRCETWVAPGTEVTPYYDPMLAKVIAKGSTRAEALGNLRAALAESRIYGIESNLEYLRQVLVDPGFEAGGVTTRYLNSVAYKVATVEVLDPGTMTTVQDYPGRLGYWHVGLPPSGPMDSLAFRLGNSLLGNPESAAGLECTMAGPILRFAQAATIAVTGAEMGATIDGQPVPLWTAVTVAAGATLQMGAVRGAGSRGYVLVRGGIDVPEYLGSRSTFTLGRLGGHGGRALRTGDVLHLNPAGVCAESRRAETGCVPVYETEWRIGVMYGPHGAPDFFTESDIETFFATTWRVHYNSSRTGVRLTGPKPEWARQDGGEAGLHPSNIHDNAYAIGTIDFTGDMPVILGPDGPSLGGFVCPATIVDAELWKIGQLKAGDGVRFVRITVEQAAVLSGDLERSIATLSAPGVPLAEESEHREPAVVFTKPAAADCPALVCRQSGDRYLLIEYGEPLLDLKLRFRVHALMQWFERNRPAGILDLTPGIRSLQIHYDTALLGREHLLEMIDSADAALPGLDGLEVPTRVVHLPLSWDDPATRLAIEKYMQSVRPDAPWCPSNIEFIRRINGLASIEHVKQIVFDASYLVLGLGDVYLGAPVATPIDPRHRLVTTKYNPARTWTPENAVGIGGAYLCVYGMEGPGGYQFVGRTVQMWNTHRSTADFAPGSPWLLRFFDQIRFYPVSGGELLEMRDAFPQGKLKMDITEETFRLHDYNAFIDSIRDDAGAFKQRQQAAFEEERDRWAAAGLAEVPQAEAAAPEALAEYRVPDGCRAVQSPITGSVWTVGVQPGERVEAGQRVLVIEAMKMEVAVAVPQAGTVVEVLCQPGTPVTTGQALVVVRT